MNRTTDTVAAAATYASEYISKNMSKKYVYHDLEHTEEVVAAAKELGEKYFLSDKEMDLLIIAAWFHDTGYVEGPENHEQRSADKADKFLAKHGYTQEDMDRVRGCIMATKIPQNPNTLMEKILADSDLNHLGKDCYWERCVEVRQELMIAWGRVMMEEEWLNFELKFLNQHRYHTDIAQATWGEQKKVHIKQLQKLRKKLFPTQDELIAQKSKRKKKKKKSIAPGDGTQIQVKNLNLGRGVETMYRVTYRTHINLSAMADNKANIMLSINAIIISIVVSTLVPQLADNTVLAIPTVMLLGTCLGSIVYATLATRPKVTVGRFTREDIEQKRSNLLFFGNFYNMEMNDFHWGMMEMIKDDDFLYSSMTRDIYWLGKVLASKYKLLSTCYRIFMWGLILSVAAFIVAYAI